MKKVFVSGCYDILHGGHVEFFSQARALGDYLVVCVPSDEVLFLHKKRRPFMPLEHRISLIRALKPVDEVVVGGDVELGINFRTVFLQAHPAILAVTEDDKYEGLKRALCAEVGAQYVRLPKNLGYEQISTTQLLERIHAPAQAPLRVDFAGGWLDVPRFARADGYVVNCAISPLVSLYQWPYETCSGLGGSGAYSLLTAQDGVEQEVARGVGWQDPVVILETGLCVWRSGASPVLDAKVNPSFLLGKMAICWTGKTHVTRELAELRRDYDAIAKASQAARQAAYAGDYDRLCESVGMSYGVQIGEGMDPLPAFGEKAKKYCGAGHGGYALYLFNIRPSDPKFVAVEPYMKRLGSGL